MTYEEALETCNLRLQFVANIYGARWKEEATFLKTCAAALEEVQNRFISEPEAELISDIFQDQYGMGLYEIAEESENAKSLFEKAGLLND